DDDPEQRFARFVIATSSDDYFRASAAGSTTRSRATRGSSRGRCCGRWSSAATELGGSERAARSRTARFEHHCTQQGTIIIKSVFDETPPFSMKSASTVLFPPKPGTIVVPSHRS